MIDLSQSAVRAALIHAQGLQSQSQPNKPPATKTDVLDIIRQMQILQIDTINVVARSPYLVLWSRLGEYDSRWLEELLAEHQIFEYWSHEASFLPVEDYPLYRRMIIDNPDDWLGWSHRWLESHSDMANMILTHVREIGPAKSSHFKRTDGVKGNWWNWKDEKVALERLFNVGTLMITGRHNFQRIYDLRERVLPDWDDTTAPSYEEVQRQMVLKSVAALGVTKGAWISDYFRMPKKSTLLYLKQLVDEGKLLEVKVEDWKEPGYIHPDQQKMVEAAAKGKLPASKTTLLSPFDPIVWDRKRALELFKFDYRIECYTPEPKRKYGYFTLPILYKNALIGRLDPKAHRKEGIFEVKALYLEPDVEVDDHLVMELKNALQACADWHKTPKVVIQRSDPPELAAQLTAVLNV
ncbi:MAG TPA: crosslink repair DNA glycosylase YcaQ family protein [Phototrophicaceae bacterium]|nr:crosslink repair DNA glycosylase YcaQ family protein [Phototrophicaceae bacterium]